MPAAITSIKEFTYRGATEEWSNTYELGNGPSTPADWRTLVDALVVLEKAVLTPATTILRALCYENDSEPSTYTYILADFAGSVPGTMDVSAGHEAPGDCASWVRWATGRHTSSGKAIYLRKYFHNVYVDETTNDLLTTPTVAALQAFGDALLAGALADGHQFAGPDGEPPDGPATAATFSTTRTLKRRGRRPPT